MKLANLILFFSILAANATVHADIGIGGGVYVTSGQGIDAVKYCKNLGYRLPTIRELALWATQYGAKVSDTPLKGYAQVIHGTDAAGNPDTFYYQYFGYKAPAKASGETWYVSSSVVPGSADKYGLYPGNGSIGDDSWAWNYFILVSYCVQSR